MKLDVDDEAVEEVKQVKMVVVVRPCCLYLCIQNIMLSGSFVHNLMRSRWDLCYGAHTATASESLQTRSLTLRSLLLVRLDWVISSFSSLAYSESRASPNILIISSCLHFIYSNMFTFTWAKSLRFTSTSIHQKTHNTAITAINNSADTYT